MIGEKFDTSLQHALLQKRGILFVVELQNGQHPNDDH